TGTGTIVWTLDGGALPVGLDLGHDGVISGTPTTSGTFTFTVRATSGTASDAKRFSITIASGGNEPDDKDGGGGGCDTGLGALGLLAIVAVVLKRK
ncbi:MAG: putative Ig domain-containing protein, partial [Synergistaceae bacterium]|nr:putative Ig domain-containing protein [Synergistaceae bacterium]